MAGRQFLLIAIDDANVTQVAQVHAAVKEDADAWWHQMKFIWIVESKEKPSFWRDRLLPFFRGVPGAVMVLRLPSDASERGWAAYGVGGGEWLKGSYGPSSVRPQAIES